MNSPGQMFCLVGRNYEISYPPLALVSHIFGSRTYEVNLFLSNFIVSIKSYGFKRKVDYGTRSQVGYKKFLHLYPLNTTSVLSMTSLLMQYLWY